MSSNKGARQRLERIFGKICMIEQAGIRYIPREKRRRIKTYKKCEDTITYHHIKERQRGGESTFENGALLKGYNHTWLHSLPEEEKQKVNEGIIQFKAMFLEAFAKSIEVDGQIKIDVDIGEEYLQLDVHGVDKKMKEKREKFKRAKIKRETQQLIDEAELEDI